jgi:hypothetical protein
MTTVVQSKYAATIVTTSISVTLDATPTQGNLLVAMWTVLNGKGLTPTLPWSGAGTTDISLPTPSEILVISRIAGPSESATISAAPTAGRNMTLTVIEVAPSSGRTWVGLDQTANASASGVTSLAVGPTSAQAEADNFAAAVLVASTATGVPQAWTDSYTVTPTPGLTDRGFSGYKVLSSTAATSTTASWLNSANVAGAIATYKQTGSGAAPQNSGFFAVL